MERGVFSPTFFKVATAWLLCLVFFLTLQAGSIHAQGVLDTAPPVENPYRLFSLAPPEREETEQTFKFAKGDTLCSILKAAGLTNEEANEAVSTAMDVLSLPQPRIGDKVKVNYGPEHEIRSLCYDINESTRLVLSRMGNSFRPEIQDIHLETEIQSLGGVVESSLFSAVEDIEENPQLALMVAQLFAWDIDFFKDLRKGDCFRLVVEKVYRDGRFLRYGRILAAEFINQDKPYRAFFYEDPEGNSDYYTQFGHSVRKQFLKAPLKFTYVSSGFSYHRFHPILKEYSPHRAIDYAAPQGTPVYAIGEGTVESCGYNWPEGKTVTIRHNSMFKSVYRHLSCFSPKIRKGCWIGQGETVGCVGCTGRTTGPHLCFSLFKNGVCLNPLKFENPPSDPVKDAYLQEFARKRDELLSQLKLANLEKPLPVKIASLYIPPAANSQK